MDSRTDHLRGWRIVARQMPAGHERYWESVFALGNGLLGARGARDDAEPGGAGLPMTFMAEVYDRPRRLPGEPRKYRRPSRLLALPNTLHFALRDKDGGPMAVVAETAALDMRRGILERTVVFRSAAGLRTRLVSQRLVSQARPHVLAAQYRLTAENYAGPLSVVFGIDGRPGYPDGIVQARETSRGVCAGTAWYAVRSLQSRVAVAAAARHRLIGTAAADPEPLSRDGGSWLSLSLPMRRGATVTLETAASIHNGIHAADPLAEAQNEVAALPGFAALRAEHVRAWAEYWKDADIRIAGDRPVQTMARFFVFHLLQSASRHNARLGLSASIPAKSMTGPGYNGHIFWDTEVYMLPFFSRQFPEIAESLLKYRFDRLDAAACNARESGANGIRFPWESADTGREECPKWLPRGEDYFRWRGGEQEIHITADVPMGCHQHFLATGDEEWLFGAALDTAVGAARYWVSVARETRTPKGVEYAIRRVIGPDEYHSSIDNSVYTNALAAWNLRWAAERVERCRARRPARYRRLVREWRLSPAELKRWRAVAGGLRINVDPATGLCEEFDGYFTHPRQQIKQADVMLMLHLLPHLSSPAIFRRNFDRYYPVTLHASSLSPALHVLFSLDAGYPEKAYPYLRMACEIDGVRKGDSADDGIHSASLGAGWSAIVDGFGGVRVGEGRLDVAPRLPPQWRELAFSVLYRGTRLRFLVRPRRLVIAADAVGRRVPLSIGGRRAWIRPGQTLTVPGRWQYQPAKPVRCPGPVRAVLFDLDGVIVSTDEFHYQAWQALADSEGIPFDRKINHRLRGVSRMESLAILLERARRRYSPAQREAMAQRKNEMYCGLLQKLDPRDILPGAMLILEQLKARGVKVAIASSSRNTPVILERIGLAARFDAVADGNDIKRSKPAPDVFLVAAKKLGIPPRRCVVVEDAEAGVLAARAAGMHCLAVGAAAGCESASASAPDLTQIDADSLLALGTGARPARRKG